jgi:ABC-2 type transport system permease protein
MEFTRIGRILQAIVMLAYGIAASRLPWNIAKVITLLLMIASGSVRRY